MSAYACAVVDLLRLGAIIAAVHIAVGGLAILIVRAIPCSEERKRIYVLGVLRAASVAFVLVLAVPVAFALNLADRLAVSKGAYLVHQLPLYWFGIWFVVSASIVLILRVLVGQTAWPDEAKTKAVQSLTKAVLMATVIAVIAPIVCWLYMQRY